MQHSITKVVLQNGAEGLLIDVPSSGVTSIDIVFRAGDYLSPAGKTDTAHVMEHLVLGANKKYPTAKSFSREFTKYGAYSNAYTGDYHMGYEAECEAGETERIIDLLCIAIESPLFSQTDFNAEIGNVREELKMRRNNDDNELTLSLENAMGFIAKSYRDRTDELPAITLEDIERHYKKTHTTKNMRFIIAGPIAAYVYKIKQRLGSLSLPQGSEYIPLPNEQPHKLDAPFTMHNENLDNVCYRWEVVLPAAFETYVQQDSLSALQDILFSGFHSRVFGELREKGLVYGIFGGYYETKNNAVNAISGQVQSDNIYDVFNILLREMRDIANSGIKQQELAELKKRVFGEVQRYHQTPSQLINWYRSPFITKGEHIHFDTFAARVDVITSESIQQVTQKLLAANIAGLGVMHNPSEPVDATRLLTMIG